MRGMLLILMFGLFGCGGDSDIKVLTEEEMTVVMTDLMLSDYTLRQYAVRYKDSIKVELTKSLLKVHNLSKEELERNIYLYSTDFEKMESLLEAVEIHLDSLSKITDIEIPEEVKLPSKLPE